ncbi:Cleavage stimulation factor subunit 2 tau variant, partial [Bulinus truncatus]
PVSVPAMGPRLPQAIPGPMGAMAAGMPGMNSTSMAAPVRPDMMMMMRAAVPQAERFPQANAMPGAAARMPGPLPGSSMMPNQRPMMQQPAAMAPAASVGQSNGASIISTQDQEKAALIMQVLQLTDEQIALLPPEQRQSILILKEQIKSG